MTKLTEAKHFLGSVCRKSKTKLQPDATGNASSGAPDGATVSSLDGNSALASSVFRIVKPAGLETPPITQDVVIDLNQNGNIQAKDMVLIPGLESDQISLGTFRSRNLDNHELSKFFKSIPRCKLGRLGKEIIRDMELFKDEEYGLVAVDLASLGLSVVNYEWHEPDFKIDEIREKINKIADPVHPEIAIDLALAVAEGRIDIDDTTPLILQSHPVWIRDYPFPQTPVILRNGQRVFLYGIDADDETLSCKYRNAKVVAALRK